MPDDITAEGVPEGYHLCTHHSFVYCTCSERECESRGERLSWDALLDAEVARICGDDEP